MSALSLAAASNDDLLFSAKKYEGMAMQIENPSVCCLDIALLKLKMCHFRFLGRQTPVWSLAPLETNELTIENEINEERKKKKSAGETEAQKMTISSNSTTHDC